MARILVVDDEIEIVELIEIYLKNEGHTTIKYYDGSEALAADFSAVDIAVLDVMMPGLDGLSLCKKLREDGYTFPIIMLTARDGDGDKINGLVYGADDYMVKPFNPLELLARINAQLRRVNLFSHNEDSSRDSYDIHGLVVNPDGHTCFLHNKEVILTKIEFAILLLLCKQRGKVIGSEEIFENVWGEKYCESNNTVMVHIQKLRRKLKDTDPKKTFIHTVWGVGYKIE